MLLDWQASLQAAAALGVVLLLIWGAAKALRPSSVAEGRSAGRRLRLIEALAIDPRRRVLLLRCDGRDLLLLTGGAEDRLLGWLPTQPDPPP
jgi:flagellar protein FliO/FliZ